MSSGYFPAGGSVLRAVHSERAVGLNYGQRALMLGAAHPVNFVGTQANTRSGARPFMRLAHTAKAFETIFFGTPGRWPTREPASSAGRRPSSIACRPAREASPTGGTDPGLRR